MAASSRLPVVVVLGATGTGKSKLALQIAKTFSAEIISADSMQVYRGLDIITNKVTAEEQKQCPHHMISYLSSLTENYTAAKFRDKAIPIIEKLRSENKLAIIVGGTNYYIEALLWNFVITKQDIENTLKNKEKTAASSECDELSTETKCSEDTETEIRCSEEKNSSDFKTDYSEESGPSDVKRLRYTKTSSNLRHTDTSSVDHLNSTGSCKSVVKAGDEVLRVDVQREITLTTPQSEAADTQLSECEDSDLSKEKYKDQDTKSLHQRLMQVDPETGSKLHPHSRRKIITALSMYDEHGVTLTEVYKTQRGQVGDDSSRSGTLRYKDTCMFWVNSDQEVLDERTDKRVDAMMEAGLLEELQGFHQQYNEANLKRNQQNSYELGIFQSIGFKEFHDYLILPPEAKDSEEGRQLFSKGVHDMKRNTRHYARKQVKWIKSRFIRRGKEEEVPSVYKLDSSDVSKWEENVGEPAIQILTDMIQGRQPRISPEPREESQYVPVLKVCEVCGGRHFVTLTDWNVHMKSRGHKKKVEKKNRLEKVQKMKRLKEEEMAKIKLENCEKKICSDENIEMNHTETAADSQSL